MAVSRSEAATFDAIRAYLQRSTASSIQLNQVGAVACIFAALLLLGMTYFIAYALSGLLFLTSSTTRGTVALFGVIAVFVLNSIYGSALSNEVNKAAGAAPGSARPINQNTDSTQMFIRMLGTIVFCGPKALFFALSLMEKNKRLRNMDYDGCAAVLVLLLSRDSRLPYGEIKQRIPKLDTATVFTQLEDVHGVLFLDSDPPGLSLSENLRRDLSLFKQDAPATPSPATR